MQLDQTFLQGVNVFVNWHFPIGCCIKKYHLHALNNPKLSLTLISITTFFLSFLRLITFPLTAILGIALLPLIALVNKIQNKSSAKWLIAWGLNILSLAITISIISSVIIFAPLSILFIMLTTTIISSITITCIQINYNLYK